MTNQCKYKEGDKVKKINGEAFSNGEFVVTVEGLDKYGKVWLKETQSWLDKDTLCLANSFTKSDLKDGMVVTYRNGWKRVILDKGLLYSDNCLSMSSFHFTKVTLDSFNEDLTYYGHNPRDIMKVTYMGEILWEREEETAEQKRIKELEEGIAKMQKELNSLMGGK
ncbi:MAG: hypothetical protein GOVbin2917_142 [Prokaryotic dsDNA virus sp.]|jgi:hypothetical protein|nr:MAG: hypothetical protein GOVbin2917_142 [Prokaryotic dsDNA virus sp.]|tara:strand:+ start:17883 stop:18380 length:498 start_codon:yes stop_codon:yes gene_type:complete